MRADNLMMSHNKFIVSAFGEGITTKVEPQ